MKISRIFRKLLLIKLLCVVFFVFLHSQHKKIQAKKREQITIPITQQVGLLPIRKKKKYRGSYLWKKESFVKKIQKKYEPYYENSKVFAIKKGRVIEIFPK